MEMKAEINSNTKDGSDQLRNYILMKQEVVVAVRSLKQFAEMRGDSDMTNQCQSLLVKLAEDRFNLAVVGQFKRGKSSLMNAVIGRNLLPTGLLPLTSAVTALCYGSQEQVFLKRKGWSFEQEIRIEELAEYVTEQGNPGNQKAVLEARIELPLLFLRRGLYFIDTPGVGSAQQENTATTYAFLPEADAVIFVTSVEAPLSAAEETFLRDIRRYVRKLFIVVNKIDLITVEEREQVLAYIRVGIERALGTTIVRLYPLSARQALAIKLNGNSDGVLQSGLEDFEATLMTFLAEDKSRSFLLSVLDRAMRLLGDETPFAQDSAGLAQYRRQKVGLESLSQSLMAGESPPAAGPTAAGGDSHILEHAAATDRVAQMDTARLLRTKTCPVCAAQSAALFDFFVHWQGTLIRDQQAQREFAETRGFCPLHTWQFQHIAAPLGISEGYAPLIDTATVELRQVLKRSPIDAAKSIGALLPSVKSCAACRVLHDAEAAALAKLFLQVVTPEGHELYAHSQGLCLPHLRAALMASPPEPVVEFFLREQIRRLEEISEDMRGFVLKRDALRRGLLNRNEENAWRYALVHLVGEQSVSAPWTGSDEF